MSNNPTALDAIPLPPRLTDAETIPAHRIAKAEHDKRDSITRSAGLPTLPCGCYSCNTVRRFDADAKHGPLGKPPKSTHSNNPATVPQHPKGAATMSKSKKAPSNEAKKSPPHQAPKGSPKAKPRKPAPAAKKLAPAATEAPSQRRLIKVARPSEAVMFRVTEDEMDAIIKEAEKNRDSSIAASIRRRLGLARR